MARHSLLALALPLLLPLFAHASSPGMIDSCDYPDDAAARSVWIAKEGSPPAATRDSDGARALVLHCPFIDGKLRLIDEILTPDSSRVWEKKDWKPGKTPDGFDKQFARDWLERSGWNKAAPAPALPADVVDGTLARYREFLAKVTK